MPGRYNGYNGQTPPHASNKPNIEVTKKVTEILLNGKVLLDQNAISLIENELKLRPPNKIKRKKQDPNDSNYSVIPTTQDLNNSNYSVIPATNGDVFIIPNFKDEVDEVDIHKKKRGKRLGTGASGKVKLAINMRTGEEVAVKITEDLWKVEKAGREFKFHNKVQPENVKGFVGMNNAGPNENKSKAYEFLTLVKDGDLFDQYKKGEIDFKVHAKILSDVFDIIAKHHEHGIVIRDVKPQNVLYDKALKKTFLLDLGTAFDLSKDKNGAFTPGTPGFAPPEAYPEYHNDSKHPNVESYKSFDVYSMGVMLLDAFFKKEEDGNWVPKGDMILPDKMWALVMTMLEENPTNRPTIENAKESYKKILNGENLNIPNAKNPVHVDTNAPQWQNFKNKGGRLPTCNFDSLPKQLITHSPMSNQPTQPSGVAAPNELPTLPSGVAAPNELLTLPSGVAAPNEQSMKSQESWRSYFKGKLDELPDKIVQAAENAQSVVRDVEEKLNEFFEKIEQATENAQSVARDVEEKLNEFSKEIEQVAENARSMAGYVNQLMEQFQQAWSEEEEIENDKPSGQHRARSTPQQAVSYNQQRPSAKPNMSYTNHAVQYYDQRMRWSPPVVSYKQYEPWKNPQQSAVRNANPTVHYPHPQPTVHYRHPKPKPESWGTSIDKVKDYYRQQGYGIPPHIQKAAPQLKFTDQGDPRRPIIPQSPQLSPEKSQHYVIYNRRSPSPWC